MANQFKHFFLKDNALSEKFKTTQTTRDNSNIPRRSRRSHAQKLLKEFDVIRSEKEELSIERAAESIATVDGTYIEFSSKLGHDLVTKSLENISKGIRLLNVREEIIGEETHTKAIVYVPQGKEGYFIDKIEKYRDENFRGTDKPKNEKLVNSIEDVRTALLEGLWTDKLELMPSESPKWCEVWLNIDVKKEPNAQLLHFTNTLTTIEIAYKSNSIVFPERIVLLIYANHDQLAELMMQSDLLAEFRAGQETAGFWVNETSINQEAWVEDLVKRLEIDHNSPVKVCILDSGVNTGHRILQPLFSEGDTLTVNPDWGTHDHESKGGHGTMMAGIVGYGKFESELLHTNKVLVTHKLCSVKLLPPPSALQTPNELWGDMTSQAISLAEIQNPEKVLLFCMAVASTFDVNKGRPSSWSGAVDKLAYGDGEDQRLIIVCAGNVTEDASWLNYPDENYVSSIQNPAQSWNSLVVGAYTAKIKVNDLKFKDHSFIAEENQLSPYSTTSLVWERKWPIKPDVVFEGGNLLRTPGNTIASHDDLDILSTSKNFNIRSFETFCATSAATAQAAWFAAKIAYEYPSAWPETIKGLTVHSASWLPGMMKQMNVRPNSKSDYNKLMKVFGYGVPNLERALYSNESALTYIAQETIQPFSFKTEAGKKTADAETNEIHFFKLPWPREDLLAMGNIPVKLKVTLSYFVEPAGGELGWKNKYRYQSFGLRFDVNKRGETPDEFRKRVNKAAREENEQVNSDSQSDRWLIGSTNRSTGSIHSDIWDGGTAADVATCNMIAIYPIIGWWRERKHLKKVETKTRYSLIVSLETPSQEVDIYAVVKNMIEVPIEIKTS